MIKLSRTFETVTPESAENGDVAEHGFLFEGIEYTLREAVALVSAHPVPSCSHGTPGWVSSYPEPDYGTGAETVYSVHPGDDPVSQKYWAKILRAAGLLKLDK